MATTAGRKLVRSSSTATGAKPSFLLFGGLALIGLLKDTLDLIGIGSLPALGTVITLCFSFFSFMLLLLFDRSGSRGNKRLAQGMVATFGALVEGLGFVINFLPLQTLTAVFLYLISYKSWKSSQQASAVVDRRQRSKFQTQQARMARAVALRKERMNRQAAAADAEATTPLQAANTVQARPSGASQPVVSERPIRPAAVSTAQNKISSGPRSDVKSFTSTAATPQVPTSLKSRAAQPQTAHSLTANPSSFPKNTSSGASSARLITADARRGIADLRENSTTPYKQPFSKVGSHPADASIRIQEAARRLSQTDRIRKG